MPATTPRSDENQDCFADKSKHPYVSAVFVKNLRAFSVDAGLQNENFGFQIKIEAHLGHVFVNVTKPYIFIEKYVNLNYLKSFFIN